MIATVKGDLNHPCFFMHIPKCGGTSIAEALYATVPMNRRIGVVDANATRRATSMAAAGKDRIHLFHDDLDSGNAVFDLREKMLLTHMAWDTSLIHGHILFSAKADEHFGSTYKYVTLMRDPLARFVSNYNGSVAHGLTTTDFNTYLSTDIARFHALTSLRYFTGQHHIPVGEEMQAVEIALENAKKFALIGFLDDLDSFCTGFENIFGRKPRVFHYNSHKSDAYQPTAQELDEARALLEPERKLWDAIRS